MYMFLNELMDENDMSRAELSRISGVPESILRDILNGKAQIDHCEAGTLMAIADALDTTVEEIVTNYWDFWESTLNPDEMEKIPVHDNDLLAYFYMAVSATLLKMGKAGEMGFVCDICNTDFVEAFFSPKSYRTALFLVGMIDYIHRKNNMNPDPRFDAIRDFCLDQPVYALDTLASDDADDLVKAKAFAEENAIPELVCFNIFMTEEDVSPLMD